MDKYEITTIKEYIDARTIVSTAKYLCNSIERERLELATENLLALGK